MDRRFALFAVLVALIFVVNQIVFSLLFPPPPKPAAENKVAAAARDKQHKKDAPPADLKAPPQEAASQDAAEPQPDAGQPKADKDEPADEPPVPPLRGTLGSGDHASPYRMLIYWNNIGAAIELVELNSPSYRSLDDFSGYLGYLAPVDAPKRAGALVRVVGPGTPAAAAGVERDDVVTAIGETRVRTAAEMLAALQETRPGQTITIAIQRGDAARQLSATLAHQPLDLIRPERDTKAVTIVEPKNHDPLSFLATIQQFDERALPSDGKNVELGGVNLRSGAWDVEQADGEEVRFKKRLPRLGLEMTKTFRLARVPPEAHADASYPAYSLTLDLQIANVDDKPHKVAYRLDGPTGLPIEGAWYANKVSRTWGGAGLRDVIVQFNGGSLEQVAPALLAKPDYQKEWGDTASLEYIAVDAQYFASAVIPQKKRPEDVWFQSVMPLRTGAVPKDVRLMNVSFRLDSKPAELAPGGAPLRHQFQIFAGPKRPALLAEYGGPDASLADLVYYGWFGPIARILGHVLHYFYSIVSNYGLAIIMLTVLVRGCMFPISRRQTQSAQRMQKKMQQLQPEMRKINEKFKNDAEKRTRATQELFKQHNYNPMDQLGGCLLAFAQAPIFIGLYRSLMVDIELRQAPLFSETIRWASNLSAPDMLWNWAGLVPDFIVHGAGIFPALGPFLNILPLVTIALFIWQQKMFMPPPADEQAAMQQKMMKYMMIFMGIMFFKVASGLCVYFIVSSLWGIGERKLMPKLTSPDDAPGGRAGAAVAVASSSPTGNGAPSGKKRQRGRK